MTPDRFRFLLDKLELNQSPLPDNNNQATSAALFFRVDERNVRRWAAGSLPIPYSVAMVLEIMASEGWKPEDVLSGWNFDL